MTRRYVGRKDYELQNKKKFRCIGLRVGLFICSLGLTVPMVSVAKTNIHMTEVENTNSILSDFNNTLDDDKDNGELTNPNDDNLPNQDTEKEIPVYTEVDEVVYAKKSCVVYETADKESSSLKEKVSELENENSSPIILVDDL